MCFPMESFPSLLDSVFAVIVLMACCKVERHEEIFQTAQDLFRGANPKIGHSIEALGGTTIPTRMMHGAERECLGKVFERKDAFFYNVARFLCYQNEGVSPASNRSPSWAFLLPSSPRGGA